MMIKGAKSIAEYAIRKWMVTQGFAVEHFKLTLDGNRGTITDGNGDSLSLVYHGDSMEVQVEE